MPNLFHRLLLTLGMVILFGSAIWLTRLLATSDPMRNKDDIYYSYVEGQRILQGTNPYSRIHAGDMQVNNKYATYFPGFYLLSAGVQLCGASDPASWIGLWRVVFAVFFLAIGALIFAEGHRRRGAAFAFFGMALWLFNRWTLYVIDTANIDFPAIFFFLLSLTIFDKHQRTALILLSVSLAIKQLAVFAVPLYLIWIWQSSAKGHRTKSMLWGAVLIACVPLACSIPFFVWDPTGFVKSVLFSVTRTPAQYWNAPSIDHVFGWPGFAGRIPMLFTIVVVYAAALNGRLGRYSGALMVMVAFILMNPVFFTQYLSWVIPLIPLAICDPASDRHRPAPAAR